MADQTSLRRRTGVDIYQQLALRLHRMVRDEHLNNLSGTERFKVLSITPIRIEHMATDLVLEEGDPDFTVGAGVRSGLTVGAEVWCLRDGQDWHLVNAVES